MDEKANETLNETVGKIQKLHPTITPAQITTIIQIVCSVASAICPLVGKSEASTKAKK
jgi:hypothetical protein